MSAGSDASGGGLGSEVHGVAALGAARPLAFDATAVERVEPSYPDLRVSVEEAKDATTAAVTEFFASHAPAWRSTHRAWKKAAKLAKAAEQPEPPRPVPTSQAARIETGVGKTATAVPAIAAAVRSGFSVVYAVPSHWLGTEIVERFADLGVEARVYRGREADDPEAPGAKMCLDQGALKDVLKAGLSVGENICARRVDGWTVRCPLYDQCGTQRQSKAKPTVWIVAHTSLFHRKPEAIAAPDALVIDEAFVMGALPQGAAGMPVDSVEHALRWQIAEAGIIQAIGRIRPLRRDADKPAFVDIISDVPLPITVDRVERWADVKPGAWAEMAGEGVILESAGDIEACYPEAAPSRKTARLMIPPTMALTSIGNLPIGFGAIVRTVTYKRLGRYKPTRATLLPNAPADLRRWLGDCLGAIEWIRYEDGVETAPARSAEDRDARPPPDLPVRSPDIQPADAWGAETRTHRAPATAIWRSFARNVPPAALARIVQRHSQNLGTPASGQIWRSQADP